VLRSGRAEPSGIRGHAEDACATGLARRGPAGADGEDHHCGDREHHRRGDQRDHPAAIAAPDDVRGGEATGAVRQREPWVQEARIALQRHRQRDRVGVRQVDGTHRGRRRTDRRLDRGRGNPVPRRIDRVPRGER
jgi:hypothetical protein